MFSCNAFQKKTPAERKDFAQANELCFNCFGKHQVSACPSKKSCPACKKRHHSSIHDAWSIVKCDGVDVSTSLHARNSGGERATVLLTSARVLVTDRYGSAVPVQALIDPRSEVSLIAESFAQRLHLPRAPASTAIYGVGGQQTGVSRGSVTVELASRVTGDTVRVTALVLPRITVYGDRVGSSRTTWPHLHGLPLADPDYRATDSVEMLLGAYIYATIVEDGLRKGDACAPIAQRTTLGWVLSGIVGGFRPHGPTMFHQCSTGEELSELVTRFWALEEPPRAPVPLSEGDNQSPRAAFRVHA